MSTLTIEFSDADAFNKAHEAIQKNILAVVSYYKARSDADWRNLNKDDRIVLDDTFSDLELGSVFLKSVQVKNVKTEVLCGGFFTKNPKAIFVMTLDFIQK